MTTPVPASLPAIQRPVDESHAEAADAAWRPLFRVGGVAALLSVAIIVVAIPIFLASPLPTTVVDWFNLLHRDALLGLIGLDLLMLVAYVLSGPIYIALFGALRRANVPLMALATIIGLVGVTTYFSSNTAFTMLSLSNQYYAAGTTDAERAQLLAAGRAMVAIWQGSAYDVSYVLGGVATLIIAAVMLRSHIFSNVTGYVGLLMGVMMLVPATAGTIGLYLALVSLVPTVLWDILIARRLFQLAAPRTAVAPAAPTYASEARTPEGSAGAPSV